MHVLPHLHRAANRLTTVRMSASRTIAALMLSAALAGCMALDGLSEATPKLSSKMVAEMSRKGMKPE
ncbi:MAG: hypothetical protein AAAC47_00605, partial [Pararhizobium sp.]